jgi:formylglycine-generating enzyme
MELEHQAFLTLETIEWRVCDIASEQLGIDRADVRPSSRIVQDLNCDSLDLVELVMAVEDAFDVALPDDVPNPYYKAVFTRPEFRIADLAELVYLQQGSGRIRDDRSGWWGSEAPRPARQVKPFTQLGGKLRGAGMPGQIFEQLETNDAGRPIYRRRMDGMVCVKVPAGEVVIGTNEGGPFADAAPAHRVRLSSFLIDSEPVSTTAYARFLNSIGGVEPRVLRDWFVLEPHDKRREHVLLQQTQEGWAPLRGTETWPMILVSWYGACAYSIWAHGADWRRYHGEEEVFLPTEAQWEYAARGADAATFPWGDGEPTQELMRYAQHVPGRSYAAEEMPMAAVNADLGVSPFGLRHMAGNVWQWCRDCYASDFYRSQEVAVPDPVNLQPTGVRSERGGSWIGPAFLCRSSYRRGRAPTARGRCLGFRCAVRADLLNH